MPDYYRGDEADGVTPPNLEDSSTYAEHIVHARGKRTRFTSLSTDPTKIRDFGTQLWRLLQPKIYDDGHEVVVHETIVEQLRHEARNKSNPEAAEFAARALDRARKRREALINWKFNTSRIERKHLSEWARRHIQQFFVRS